MLFDLLHGRLKTLLAGAWIGTCLTASAQIDLKIGATPGTPPATLSSAATARVNTPHVQAELMAYAPQGVASGQPLWLGLQIRHQPGWHTYWKNPGETGLPTQMQWHLPPGLAAGEIDWPTPHKIQVGALTNFGYEGDVLLPVPVKVAASWAPQGLTVPLRLKASWLVCRQECIPEEGEFALDLPVGSSTAAQGGVFDAAWKDRPLALPGLHTAAVQGQQLTLTLQGLPAEWRGKAVSMYPETPEVLDSSAPVAPRWEGNAWIVSWPLAAQRSTEPNLLPVVLVGPTGPAYRAELKVEGTWPAAAAAASVSPALQAALEANRSPVPQAAPNDLSGPALALALLGALAGGLILNLMPCVFPVLAIKLLSFAGHGQTGSARTLRLQGLAYTAGVVLSFLALGTLMLTLRAGGAQLGWGFQLQSPLVVAGLAALFTLIGLNLAGLFDVGTALPGRWASARLRHPAADAALSGVLAVAVASPCTAPFMGASLGLTATLPTAAALAVFAALGLGMALPYLVVAVLPGAGLGLARRLPRPGVWMLQFRQLMSFPMFATVAWLVWVLGQQSGIDGAGALLALLVVLSGLVWGLTRSGPARWWLGGVFAALGVWMLIQFGPHVVQPAPSDVPQQTSLDPTDWQPWSAAKAQALVAEGRPVFVDFTAAWCVTCQFNKRTTLSDTALLRDLAQGRVALLRADWTRQDPAITAELHKLGRSGVPVYLVLRPGRPPAVLSELLSVADVRHALDLPSTP